MAANTNNGSGGEGGAGGGAAGPPIGLLANGALFVPPQFYNLPHFGYAGLDAQMQDAMANWQKGAGVFAGNNVPKFNGLPGSDPNGTFGGGFANMAPTVGGGVLGAGVYSGGWNPYAGRGNQPPGPGGPPGGGGPTPPGTQPPGGPILPGPGNGANPVRPNVPNQPPNAGGITNPGLLNGSVPNNTSTVGPGVGGITGLLGGAAGTTPGAPKAGMGAQGTQPGPAPYPNNWAVPQNSNTIKNASGQDVPNPYGLTTEQIYWALSGNPDAIRRLGESVGGYGPNANAAAKQLFHGIVNYYEAGGGGFQQGGGYTAEDAARAQANYAQGLMGGVNPANGQALGPRVTQGLSPEAIAFQVSQNLIIKGADGNWYYNPAVSQGQQ